MPFRRQTQFQQPAEDLLAGALEGAGKGRYNCRTGQRNTRSRTIIHMAESSPLQPANNSCSPQGYSRAYRLLSQ
ncbi:hypothetical protein CY34DRAFT_802914 [Suillus luteus UH-Slu-Lm8-n1]|uniref:Uncharacterized protein n=1 Tax=Suillus luteus UH-Slu-Lm8-n1 TaxID=930992 RepID=A0A0D0AR49_9AGAM|nr:hypothetical protein CY34DRAFT_802914 [Suillus luteus UH-Slu-Lm8-n1]